ncbi:dienelactone hydrolase family protein [Actinomycetospora sp. TBRC 11914]|uniref:dienelactone hydrolase family protein n=1 Tax=Actinomycetospora sp. TBRC 11914 TaxID=2729387 RepID=UPI00145D3B5A|nr:dienelactone hydrolase family protein [Actinomycetospora sp. TBRC 11914]NMO91506.1 dienelactone hydrolase family protein [Actinomycetospora sp. TBRC 11914]
MSAPVQNTTFPSNGHTAHGYLALPPGGHGPGLVVIQEWWGLTTHVADLTDRFAAAGFVALAPDLYGGPTTHDAAEAEQLMRELPVDRAAQDLAGAVTYLLGHEAVTGDAVGAVGFCMGGGFVLLLAAQQGERIGAAVPFYGVPPVEQDFRGLTAAVLGHYAEQDAFLPVAAVEAVRSALEDQAPAPAEFHFYPAGHAFLNDENPLGTYDPEQAALAWSRTVDFLQERLDPAAHR